MHVTEGAGFLKDCFRRLEDPLPTPDVPETITGEPEGSWATTASRVDGPERIFTNAWTHHPGGWPAEA